MSSQTQSSQTPSKCPHPVKSMPLSLPVTGGEGEPGFAHLGGGATGDPVPKPPKAKDNGPPDPAIMAIFCKHWFLNRDHLIANVLSAQKSDAGCFTWVDFLPPFHKHLVQCAQVLLPPLCPMAKGEKVLFAFIIEILDGDGPKPGSFWIVPKKRHHHSLKKPKDPEEKTPGPQDKTPTVSHEAPAVIQKPGANGKGARRGVGPSAPTNPPPPPQPPSLSSLSARSPGHLPYVNTFLSANPFPPGYDLEPVYQWRVRADTAGLLHTIMVQIAEEAGHPKSEMKFFREQVLGFRST
jgi:hypothetical protein